MKFGSITIPYSNSSTKVLVWEFPCREVTGTTISILGILGNILAIFVLMQRDMRNTFNKLLVTLSCFDILLLFESALAFLLENSEATYRNALYIYMGCYSMLG